MNNLYLSPSTAKDIDQRVGRVLAGLGKIDLPLDPKRVLAHLGIERGWFDSTDFERMRWQEWERQLLAGGRAVAKSPMLFRDVVAECQLKAVYLPDQRRILIDSGLALVKQRWAEAHEIIHSLLPWHGVYVHGDNRLSLAPSCHAQLEAEANYGASQLLFLQDRFLREWDLGRLTFSLVKSVAAAYGNSITSTMWKLVEASQNTIVGLIANHPTKLDLNCPASQQSRYLLRSRRFERTFPTATKSDLYCQISGAIASLEPGVSVCGELALRDSNGHTQMFETESFYNSYEVLTLASLASVSQTVIALRGSPVSRFSQPEVRVEAI